MAFVIKTISNKKTGQDIKFIQTAKSTNGLLLEMESTFRPGSIVPPAHYHPYQSEDFEVLFGEVTVKVNSETRIVKQGDKLHIPKNTVHAMWNQSEANAVVNWKVQPAMNTENLLETITGLANDDKTDDTGRPVFLQAVLTINKFSDVYRLANPPFAVIKIVFTLLTPFAYLFGYRPVYKKYID